MPQFKNYDVVTFGGAWILTCPRCGNKAQIDKDQLEGKVSCLCPMEGCRYHETVDLRPFVKKVED